MKTSKFNLSAIIYDKKGNVLSIGKNSYWKTHPIQAKFARKVGQSDRIFLHAEIDAIVRCHSLKDAHHIFVTRINSKGEALLAKPCPICMAAIAATPIKRIEHT